MSSDYMSFLTFTTILTATPVCYLAPMHINLCHRKFYCIMIKLWITSIHMCNVKPPFWPASGQVRQCLFVFDLLTFGFILCLKPFGNVRKWASQCLSEVNTAGIKGQSVISCMSNFVQHALHYINSWIGCFKSLVVSSHCEIVVRAIHRLEPGPWRSNRARSNFWPPPPTLEKWMFLPMDIWEMWLCLYGEAGQLYPNARVWMSKFWCCYSLLLRLQTSACAYLNTNGYQKEDLSFTLLLSFQEGYRHISNILSPHSVDFYPCWIQFSNNCFHK